MRAVSRFEANLLQVLRVVLRQAPREQAAAILHRPLPRPRCLSRAAVELAQDALAKGTVHYLARHGWMRERFLRDEVVADGRLWERTPPGELGLTFSAHALEFLVQLVSGTLGASVPKVEQTTVGDRLLFFFSFDALGSLEPGEALRKKWLPLHEDGLCRLAFLADLPDDSKPCRIDWSVWTAGVGASVLEALQGELSERFAALERAKGTMARVARMRKLGATQARVYGEYLDAIERAKRRDLARCILAAAHRLLADRPGARKWIGALDLRGERVAERRAIYHDALAFVRLLARLQSWQQEAGQVGYFDDGYHASQLWKADWERVDGDQLYEQACAILREAEPLLSPRSIP